MGMRACYLEVNSDTIDKLKAVPIEDLSEEIEEIQDDEASNVLEIDKIWDGLHCLLTGVSASTPIEDDLLSESIVGHQCFSDDEDDDFDSYTYPERVEEIVKKLNSLNIDEIIATFSTEDFAKKKIYPNIWRDEDHDMLKEELVDTFKEVKKFFNEVAENKNGIITSIC